MAVKKDHEMSVAILRAAGIPHDHATAVSYHHTVGEMPELTVTFTTWDVDAAELNTVTTRFVAQED